jgi:hypothetical protein
LSMLRCVFGNWALKNLSIKFDVIESLIVLNLSLLAILGSMDVEISGVVRTS